MCIWSTKILTHSAAAAADAKNYMSCDAARWPAHKNETRSLEDPLKVHKISKAVICLVRGNFYIKSDAFKVVYFVLLFLVGVCASAVRRCDRVVALLPAKKSARNKRASSS